MSRTPGYALKRLDYFRGWIAIGCKHLPTVAAIFCSTSESPSDPRLPSLVRAMKCLLPRSVMKEVVDSANDRRQWGVLAAAWIGVSEREFMSAVAKELRLEFEERVPSTSLRAYGSDAKELLVALRRCAAAPVFEGAALVKLITVDPAEVRGVPTFDGSQRITIGCWSDISRALDEAEREIRDRDEELLRADAAKKEELSRKVLDVIMHEAAAHGANMVEIVTIDQRSRYQFITIDGKRGYGGIHAGVVQPLFRYLARIDSGTFSTSKRSAVLVRSLGTPTSFRLTWSSEILNAHGEVPLQLTSARADGSVVSMVECPIPPHVHRDTATTLGRPSEPSPCGIDGLERPSEQCAVRTSEGAERQDLRSQLQDHDETKSDARCTTPSQPQSESLIKTPILVVDDNPMFSRVLERLLLRDNFAPYFAENGAKAWEKLDASPHFLPKVIVSDLHMPIMNGRELLAKLRGDPRFESIPVIMLTSDDGVEAELSLLGIGADAFVSKTKDPRVLCAHVRRLAAQAEVRIAA